MGFAIVECYLGTENFERNWHDSGTWDLGSG
jgi:hypothetical protein